MKKDNDSVIIRISPRIEDWFYKRANHHQIDPFEYGLPRNPNELHSIPHYEKKAGFKGFLTQLIDMDEEIGTLKTWIFEHIEKENK